MVVDRVLIWTVYLFKFSRVICQQTTYVIQNDLKSNEIR